MNVSMAMKPFSCENKKIEILIVKTTTVMRINLKIVLLFPLSYPVVGRLRRLEYLDLAGKESCVRDVQSNNV